MYKYFAALSLALCCTLGMAVQASAGTSAAPVIASLTSSPKALPGNGGSITVTVRVRNATTCVFGGAVQVTKSCAKGEASATFAEAANSTAVDKTISLWVYAEGHGRRSSRRAATFTEAATPTSCTGPCTFTFPAPDDEGVASVTINSVSEGVAWPDPLQVQYGLTDLPAGDQLEEVSVTTCAGPTGINDGSLMSFELPLVLSTGSQASVDSVTFDSTVAGAFGIYGAIGAGQCVSGDIYYDTPIGSAWTAVNFSYASGVDLAVYTWNAS
ncbi:MAG TPA: hypothetical protein VGG17_09165 [Acidimicrobiales bacterium]